MASTTDKLTCLTLSGNVGVAETSWAQRHHISREEHHSDGTCCVSSGGKTYSIVISRMYMDFLSLSLGSMRVLRAGFEVFERA